MNSIFLPIDKIHGDEHLGPDVTDAEIKQRCDDFWCADDKDEAAGFLAVECVDDPEAAHLLYDLCALEVKLENGDLILKAAGRLMKHLQAAIYQHAANDKLPFNDSLPFIEAPHDPHHHNHRNT